MDRVIVSTEDEEIADVARSFSAEVPFIRPKKYAMDNSSGIEPIMHALETIPNVNDVLVLQPTSPLRRLEDIDGIFLDLPGYRLKITGGSDNSGVPLRGDIDGNQRRKLLLTESVGFHPVKDGQRRRKLIRGRNLNSEVSQINLKVIEYGPKSIEELLQPEEA